MSNNDAAAVRDSLIRRLAEAEERGRLHRRVTPIVDCIRNMRSEGLADNEIAGLLRHAADELDETALANSRYQKTGLISPRHLLAGVEIAPLPARPAATAMLDPAAMLARN